MPARILLTGADGFTGLHFTRIAAEHGHDIIPLSSDLTDPAALKAELARLSFDHVVHLAGISAVTHADLEELYRVNLFGTLNLLSAIEASKQSVGRVLVASSANVYGNCDVSPIAETVCPDPVNHYAMSKLAMEKMAMAYREALPLVFVRPFNYTGVGHDDRFVIPKIVNHFAKRSPVIELGNMHVQREFNDVRMVCRVYLDLLEKARKGEIYNLCSGATNSLGDVLDTLATLTGHKIEARLNPQFVRPNELARLAGDPSKLEACIGPLSRPSLGNLLEWMLDATEKQ